MCNAFERDVYLRLKVEGQGFQVMLNWWGYHGGRISVCIAGKERS